MNLNKEDFKLFAVIIGSVGCIVNIFYLLWLQYRAGQVPSLEHLYMQKYYLLPLILWCGLILWGGDSKNF